MELRRVRFRRRTHDLGVLMSEAMNLASVALKVTNRNGFELKDRYDGVPFKFPANATVSVPLDAAIHFFGFKPGAEPGTFVLQADFNHVCRRYGWGNPMRHKDEEMHDAMTRATTDAKTYFDNLEIKAVRREVVETPIEEDALPEPRVSAAELAAQDDQKADAEIVGGAVRPVSVPLVRRKGARETA